MKYRIALSYINRDSIETTPFSIICDNKERCIETLKIAVFPPFVLRGEYYKIRIFKPDYPDCVCSITRNYNEEAGLTKDWIKFTNCKGNFWASPVSFIHDKGNYPLYDSAYNFKTFKSFRTLFDRLITEAKHVSHD